jgi:hypothetical protein
LGAGGLNEESSDDLLTAQLELVEQRLFDIITEAVSSRRQELPPAALADAFALRAYSPWRRDFDDIDLVFPSSTDPSQVRAFAEDCPGQAKLIVGEPRGHFIRVKYVVPELNRLGSDFRIDFHIGGIWHHDDLFPVSDDSIFTATWVEIPSIGGRALSLLPVLKVEDLLVLKIVKFIGGDQQDCLTILSLNTLDIAYVADRLRYRSEVDTALDNLTSLAQNHDSLLESWSVKHHADLSFVDRLMIRMHRDQLETALRAHD